MQKILDTIIGENQSTAIKKRTTLHTISTIHDMIDVSNKLNKNFFVISLDFIKAFDRADCDFIFFSFVKFGIWRQIHLHI